MCKCCIILTRKQVYLCIFLKNACSSFMLLAIDWISRCIIKFTLKNFLNFHLSIYIFFDKSLRSLEIWFPCLCTLKMLLGNLSPPFLTAKEEAAASFVICPYVFAVGFRSGHTHGNRTGMWLSSIIDHPPPGISQMLEIQRNSPFLLREYRKVPLP